MKKIEFTTSYNTNHFLKSLYTYKAPKIQFLPAPITVRFFKVQCFCLIVFLFTKRFS